MIDTNEMDPLSPHAYLRLGFILTAYRERKEIEWNKFEHNDLAMALRLGMVGKDALEAVFGRKKDLFSELETSILCYPPRDEKQLVLDSTQQWEHVYGKLGDAAVAQSIDAVVAAMEAARLKNMKNHV